MAGAEFQQLGRYLLVDRIASGGMADVYRAKLVGVEGFEKDVAIKRILPHWSGNREFVEMLIDEAKVLLHLNHSNIVQVFELNKEANIYFIVMEYVEGVDLKTLLKRLQDHNEKLSVPLALFITKQICQGLIYAHNKKDKNQKSLGIVHRDISPQNILISFDGEVKVTDFGIAKVVGKTSETVTGTLKGKFAYMSPEQAFGEDVNHLTDIFALGILLYEMVTGERCFKGANDLQTLEAVRKASFSFSDKQNSLPPEIKNIIFKALQKNQADRYQSIDEFRLAIIQLENILGFHITTEELKAFLSVRFSDVLHKKHAFEEDLSQKTRQRFKTISGSSSLASRQTKVLVAKTSDSLSGDALSGDALSTEIHAVTQMDVPPDKVSPDSLLATRVVLPSQVSSSAPRIDNKLPIKTNKQKKILTWLVPSFVVLLLAITWMFFPHAKKNPPPVVNPPQVVVQPQVVVPPVTPTPKPAVVSAPEVVLNPVPTPPVEVKENSPLPAPVAPSPTIAKPVVEEVAPKAGRGGVKVSAKPYGVVSIPGIVNGAETTMIRNNIPVGEYTVRVSFPPRGLTVTTKLYIKADTLVTCQATFSDKSKIWCQ